MAKKTVAKEGAGKNAQGKISPLGDRVLVRPFSDESTKTASGIIIPDTIDKEKPEQGVVIAVGPGRYIDGERRPIEVSQGDKVVFSKYGYDEVRVGDEEYYLIKEDNILAIIK
jgi:chaperonin GroES